MAIVAGTALMWGLAGARAQMMGGMMESGRRMMGGPAQSSEKSGGNAGEAVYQGSCSGCHGSGMAGAPRLGDKTAWQALLAKEGKDVLIRRALEGYQGSQGYMPAKGGNSSLTDDQIAAAVGYMIQRSR